MIESKILGTIGFFVLAAICAGSLSCRSSDEAAVHDNDMLPTKTDVVLAMRRANDYWIENHVSPGGNDWARAVYFEGNTAMYAVYPDDAYLSYAVNWANSNNWGLIGGATTVIADNHCAGQTYIDLYRINPVPQRIEMIESSLASMQVSNTTNYWWWVDALQMAMPVFAKVAVLRNDIKYAERMYEIYNWTKYSQGTDGLYNKTDHLWWRDATFKPPVAAENGKNLYWSRGNGWAIAAHVRVIEEIDKLPVADPHRAEYVQTLQEMASALAAIQQPDGFWYQNLLDPTDPAGPETSGTAFFTYALAWGVNHHILPAHTYLPTIARAWHALAEVALGTDGRLGYIQPGAISPTRATTKNDHFDFGVGAFLLAGSEVLALANGPMPRLISDLNMAHGSAATASASQTGNEALYAVDNDLTTYWCAQGYPQWLELDLGEAHTIRGAELAPYKQRPYQFRIETKASQDAIWETVVDDTANRESSPFFQRMFDSREVRFVRLTITGIDSSAIFTDQICVDEFRVLE